MTKIFALFLPQFHEDQHNNEWWGEGFTEWVNVRNSCPYFEGHYQPKVPLEENYYQLDNAVELNKQFQQAKEHGLDGFVFYHYWSLGTRLLKKPLDLILEDKSIAQNSEFSLCWANHSWTRSWTNRSGASDVLIEQSYEKTKLEMASHIEFLISCFEDKRYTRIENKPLFQIYKPEDVPNLRLFLSELRNACQAKLNTNPYFCGLVTGWQPSRDCLANFDAVTLAQPAAANNAPIDVFDISSDKMETNNNLAYLLKALPTSVKKFLYPIKDIFDSSPTFLDYSQTCEKIAAQNELASKSSKYQVNLSCFVDFDNTARYKNRAKIFRGFEINKFKVQFKTAYTLAVNTPGAKFLLINAWNEWAEGMYLQPDEKYKNAKLEVVKSARKEVEHHADNVN